MPGLVDGLVADVLHLQATTAQGGGGGGAREADGQGAGGNAAAPAHISAAAAAAAIDRRLMLLQRILYGAELAAEVPAGMDQLITVLVATTQANTRQSVQALGTLVCCEFAARHCYTNRACACVRVRACVCVQPRQHAGQHTVTPTKPTLTWR